MEKVVEVLVTQTENGFTANGRNAQNGDTVHSFESFQALVHHLQSRFPPLPYYMTYQYDEEHRDALGAAREQIKKLEQENAEFIKRIHSTIDLLAGMREQRDGWHAENTGLGIKIAELQKKLERKAKRGRK
jgi:hypothetical protein